MKVLSPFTDYFAEAMPQLENCAGSPENDYICPEGFDAVRRIIHCWPLWSACLVDSACEGANTDTVAVTNAADESYFRALKVQRMGARNRLTARDVIIKQLPYVRGKLNTKCKDHRNVSYCNVILGEIKLEP